MRLHRTERSVILVLPQSLCNHFLWARKSSGAIFPGVLCAILNGYTKNQIQGPGRAVLATFVYSSCAKLLKNQLVSPLEAKQTFCWSAKSIVALAETQVESK